MVYVHHDLARGLWVRGATGTGPVLTSAFIAFLPGDSVSATSNSPQVVATPASGSSTSSTPGPVGYFDTYEPLAYLRKAVPSHGAWVVESNSPWGPKMHTTALAEVGASGLPSVLAVYRDTRLFRHVSFPGCDNSGTINHCLLSLVRLPLSACVNSQPGTYGPNVPISWTCADLLNGMTTDVYGEVTAADQRTAENLSTPGCIRLVAGSSLSAITGYATEAIKRPYLRSSTDAGVVAQFCGAPLPQLISVDSIGGRVFFAQRLSPAANTRRLSDAATAGPARDYRAEPASQDHATGPSPVAEQLASDEKGEAGIRHQTDGTSPPRSGELQGETTGGASFPNRRLKGGKRIEGLASICISSAYLDGYYDDVTRCVPVATEAEGSDALGDPVYMQVDPLTDAMMFAAFDSAGQLVLSLHHVLTLKRKFAVRFEGFKSGRRCYLAAPPEDCLG